MGYQEIEIPTGYNLFTVTFSNIDGEDYDIQDISLYQTDGTPLSATGVTIQPADSDGKYSDTKYKYTSAKTWYTGVKTTVERGTVKFKNGEAVCFYNGTKDPVRARVSGQVNLEPWSMKIESKAYALVGNMTPVTIDIQDIKICDADGNEVTGSGVTLQTMDTEGKYSDTKYKFTSEKTWYTGVKTTVPRDTVTFTAGKSFCIYNGLTSPVMLKYKAPIEK